MTRKDSSTQLVRQYAAAHCLVRKKQMETNLGLTKATVKYAVDTLKKQGFLKKVSHGLFEFVEQRENPNETPVEDKIWRAMRINPTFSASGIAMQAGSTTSYVYKRFRVFREEGFVKPSGKQKAISGDWEKVWRLTQKGQKHARAPRIETFVPDPLIDATVGLNKIICSGMAQRNDEDRLTALTLCNAIMKRLKEDAEG